MSPQIFRVIRRLPFFAVPFLVFWWMVPFLSPLSVGNDYLGMPIPEQMELQFALKTGTYPLFCPSYAGGVPAVTLSQAQFFHPLSHLAAAMPGYWNGKERYWNTFWRFIFLGLTHLLLYKLARRLRTKPVLAFCLSFAVVYNLRMLECFRLGIGLECYLGYLFLCTTGFFYFFKPSPFRAVGVAVSASMLATAGHPQLSYFGFLGALFFFLLLPDFCKRLLPGENFPLNRKNFYLRVSIFTLSGLLLVAAFIFPYAFDFFPDTARNHFNLEGATAFQNNLMGLLKGLFDPWVAEVHGFPSGSTLILPVFLIPLLPLFRVKIPKVVLGFWSFFILLVLMSLGSNTFLYGLFWKYFPLAQCFRIPPRSMTLLPFTAMLLLTWLTGPAVHFQKIKPSPFAVLAALSAALYLFYFLIPLKILRVPGVPYSPVVINSISGATLWSARILGFCVLVWFALSGWIREKRAKKIFLLLLTLFSAAHLTLLLRYGTWTRQEEEPKKINWAKLLTIKKFIPFGKMGNSCLPEWEMGSKLFNQRLQQGYFESRLARLAPKFKIIHSLKEAYANLGDPEIITVENFHRTSAAVHKKSNINPLIQLVYNCNYYDFSVTTAEPTFFVLVFTQSPHWKCWINGNSTPIYRANGMEQAIWLPEAGDYEVEFRYESKAVTAGVCTTLVMIFGLGVYAFGLLEKRRFILIVIYFFAIVALGFFWFKSFYEGGLIQSFYFWPHYPWSPPLVWESTIPRPF